MHFIAEENIISVKKLNYTFAVKTLTQLNILDILDKILNR